MAKGFKVIPKETPKKEEWDYAKIKERVKGKQIVFCLPGRGCSYVFLKNFVQLCFDLVQNGNGIQISQDYSSMVNFARCKVLGANVLRGPKQIPWDGKLKYDYQLWIDSDIVFDTNKFWQLIDLATKDAEVTQEVKDKDGKLVSTQLGIDDSKVKEITAGWYATEDGHTTSPYPSSLHLNRTIHLLRTYPVHSRYRTLASWEQTKDTQVFQKHHA